VNDYTRGVSILEDPWVTKSGDGYEVATNAGLMRVLPNDALGWGVYAGDNLGLVTTGQGSLIGYATPEAAVEVALNLAKAER